MPNININININKDEWHYYCKKCGHDRGILDHSQYSTICPDCGGRYTVEKVEDK